MMDRIELIKYIRSVLGDKPDVNIVEVGVLRGEYASEIVKVFDKAHIYLVDTWNAQGNDPYFSKHPEELAQARVLVEKKFGNNPNVTIVPLDSVVASFQFRDEFFDWGYIDANHTRPSVELDTKTWYPKIKIGGVISGHDFDPDPSNPNSATFGVNEAVRNMFGNSYNLTDEKFYRSWYHVKLV